MWFASVAQFNANGDFKVFISDVLDCVPETHRDVNRIRSQPILDGLHHHYVRGLGFW